MTSDLLLLSLRKFQKESQRTNSSKSWGARYVCKSDYHQHSNETADHTADDITKKEHIQCCEKNISSDFFCYCVYFILNSVRSSNEIHKTEAT